jgi:hypothetical protein
LKKEELVLEPIKKKQSLNKSPIYKEKSKNAFYLPSPFQKSLSYSKDDIIEEVNDYEHYELKTG